VFSYKHGVHNVVQVNTVAQYSMCEVPRNSTVWSSGNDRVTLARGVSFFVCGIPGHCQKGIKIAVTARYIGHMYVFSVVPVSVIAHKNQTFFLK
jgi:hypothetical protein